MRAQAALKRPEIDVEEHTDDRGDIQTVFRRRPTVGEMTQQPKRGKDNVAQMQKHR